MEPKVIFENEHFVAADKPSAMLTTPSRLGPKDLRSCLGTILQEKMGQIYPIHRLDFEVSGVVLFARNPKAHTAAQKWWETRFVTKRYEAFTHDLNNGMPARAWQNWQSKLLRGKRRAYESPIGREAITQAQFTGMVTEGRATEGKNRILRWSLIPHTGRPHQLRYELAKHGYPILGDFMYGANALKQPDIIALRAVQLDFRGLSDRITWKIPEEIQVSALSLKDYIN